MLRLFCLGLQQVKPQTMSNLLWAYATLNRSPKRLLGTLAMEALRQLNYFKPQVHLQLLSHLLQYSLCCRPHQELPVRACFLLHLNAAVTWATSSNLIFENLPVPQAGLHAQLTLHVPAIHIPQEVSNTLWAYATLDYNPGPQLLGEVCIAILKQISMFKPQELSNTLWAFATLRHHPGDSLMSSATAEAYRLVCSQLVCQLGLLRARISLCCNVGGPHLFA